MKCFSARTAGMPSEYLAGCSIRLSSLRRTNHNRFLRSRTMAPVDRIEPYGDRGKYKLIFSEPAKAIEPIPFGDAPSGTTQGPRYTTIERLLKAKSVTEALG